MTDKAPHVFVMQDVQLTTSEGGSWSYRMTAQQAYGDRRRITMKQLKLNGVPKQPSYDGPQKLRAYAAQGAFELKKRSGTLKGGLVLHIDDTYRVTTEEAHINGSLITTKMPVHIVSPNLSMHMQGARIDTQKQHFASIGDVNGTFFGDDATLPAPPAGPKRGKEPPSKPAVKRDNP